MGFHGIDYYKMIANVIAYRKPAAVGQEFISVKKFAPKCTTFQGHRNKFKFYRTKTSCFLSNLKT